MSARKPTKTLVKFIPSGIGIFLTASFALGQDLIPAIAAAFFTGLTTLWIRFSDRVMQRAEDYAADKGDKFADFAFTTLDLMGAEIRQWFTQRWWQLTANFEGKYYERLAYKCRNFQAQGLEANSDRTLKLKDVYVNVSISQRVMSQISPNLLKRLENRDQAGHYETQIGDFLALLKKEPDFRRLVILGAPGSGKTTLMRYLSLMYANQTPHELHPKAPQFIPVLLYLREEYPKILANPVLLEEFLPQWVTGLQKSKPLKTPPGWFAQQLRNQRCLILLDGLDEVADERDRQRLRDWVDEQMYEYPETPFILTSRPAGYTEKAELKQDSVVLEVEPLDSEQIHEFVRNWYLALETKKQGGQADLGVQDDAVQQAQGLITEIEQNADLSEMASNPLLLTMIATVHRYRSALPRSQVELYREICQVLLEKRQRAKGIPDVLSADQKQSILQPLALALTQRKTLKFTANDADVKSLLAAKLATLPNNPYTPETFLVQLRDVDALIAKDDENSFEFAHRSFQEYLAATEIRDTQQEGILIDVFQDSELLEWWRNTITLYAPQADVSNLLTAALQKPTLPNLEVAITCWQLGRATPSVKQALLDELAQPLAVLDEEWLAVAQQKQPTYFKLAYLLRAGDWQAADYETFQVIELVGDRDHKGYLSSQDFLTFPCDNLHIIDQLWVKYSQGIFGFSVQKQIYADCGAVLDGQYAGDKIWNDFCNRVGWKIDDSHIPYNQLKADPSFSPGGEFPAGWGELGGWCGILFSRIQTCKLCSR